MSELLNVLFYSLIAPLALPPQRGWKSYLSVLYAKPRSTAWSGLRKKILTGFSWTIVYEKSHCRASTTLHVALCRTINSQKPGRFWTGSATIRLKKKKTKSFVQMIGLKPIAVCLRTIRFCEVADCVRCTRPAFRAVRTDCEEKNIEVALYPKKEQQNRLDPEKSPVSPTPWRKQLGLQLASEV